MVRSGLCALAVLGLPSCVAGFGDICRPADPDEGYCTIDGKDCTGDEVFFNPYVMTMGKWDATAKKSNKVGTINSYAIVGNAHTWENQLHGPHLHIKERASSSEDIPPLYAFATFMNKVYRFENFSLPDGDHKNPKPIKATQKMVAHALAPSTGYIVEDDEGGEMKGMMIAEGQPFYFNSMMPSEFYTGGVEVIKNGHKKNCSMVFPHDGAILGHVTNTVDCHKALGICFFTVWRFYDDTKPLWSNMTAHDNDCLWYCVMEEGSLTTDPRCAKIAKATDAEGKQICHADGVGAVHGMTVGNTDATDPTIFDILLVFTGKAAISDGESSMKKQKVQVVGTGNTRDIKVLSTAPFATDLFTKYGAGRDVGGDHVWVDSTGKYVWISCFRVAGVGLHMVHYETGELIYSVTGIDKYVPGQYTYTSGIHGVGTIGQKGSYIAAATSSCHSVDVCIPVVPEAWPVPRSMWSAGSLFVIDLSSMTEDVVSDARETTVVV